MSHLLYTLPDLPYAYEALEPVISREIMMLHHDKHHAAYVSGANDAIAKLEAYRNKGTEVDVRAVMRDLTFNVNGHILQSGFWKNMRATQEENTPTEKVMEILKENDYSSFDSFKKEFSEAAKKVEGSGWAVLGANHDGKLLTYQVEKQNLMHLANFQPILVLDVWEHAYYLDYKNDRGAYVDAWWKVVNWTDVENRLCGCMCCKDHKCEGCDTEDGCCGGCD